MDDTQQVITNASGELALGNVPPGPHRVRILAPGKQDWTKDILIRAGDNLEIGPDLREAAGSIALRTVPGAEVFIDGGLRGTTDGSGQFEIRDLTPRSYQVRLVRKGFEDWQQTVVVSPGAPASVAAEMRQKAPAYVLHATLTGHQRTIMALGFSPDGIWLVSGSQDGSARLWEVPRAAQIREVIPTNRDDPESVYSLAFSPDGRLLVTGQRRLWWRNQLRFWEVDSWAETKISGITRTIYSRVSSVTFSHDGRLLAAHIDDDVRVWEIAVGREVLKLEAPIKIKVGQYVLGEIAFALDDSLLAAAGRDVIVWKMPKGTVAYRIPGQAESVAFSPDGKLLATSGKGLTLRDAQTGEEIRMLAGATVVGAVAFSPDNRVVAGGCADGVLKLWDPSTGKELQTLLRHAGSVSIVVFSNDGQWLAFAGADKVIKLWRLQE